MTLINRSILNGLFGLFLHVLMAPMEGAWGRRLISQIVGGETAILPWNGAFRALGNGAAAL
jgi:hypothetical protein